MRTLGLEGGVLRSGMNEECFEKPKNAENSNELLFFPQVVGKDTQCEIF